MIRTYSRTLKAIAVPKSVFSIGRLMSNVITSRVTLPALSSEVVNTPLPHFILKNFLDSDQKNKVYLMDGMSTKTLTYGESYYTSYSFADSLKDLGLKKDDVVSVVSPNHIHYFSVLMGTMLAGGVSSTVNPLYSTDEMQHQFSLTESKFYVTHALCLDRVVEVTSGDKVVILMDDGLSTEDAKNLVAKYPNRKIHLLTNIISTDASRAVKYDYDWKKTRFDPDSVAVIPFSSGTTGRSKGVMITHKNLVCNVIQTMAFEGDNLVSKKGEKQNTLLIPLPFFHIFGFTAGLLVAAHAGCRHIFMPQFDLKRFLEIIQTYEVNRSFVVPPIVLALAKHPLIDQYNLKSLKALMSGAAPLGLDVQKAAATRLNCIVKQAWGMTETSPAAAITPDSELKSVTEMKGSAGLLLPGTEGKIVDPVSGQDLPPSQEGELLVRGPQIMKGYYKNPEATKNTINKDGWLHTGDIARFDGDWLYITDRLKELIKYKGFQVPPAELEAIIASMPDVKDVIVIPVPDEEAGEVPRAYVVKKDAQSTAFTEQHVIDFVHASVAPHKRLRGGVFFTNEVPKSASGKLLRRVQIQIDRELHPTEPLLK